MEFEKVIEVFVRGFAFTKSFTHPYEVAQVEGVWVMRDGPRTRGDYRKEEYVVYGKALGEAHALAKRSTRGRYFLCVVRTNDEPDGEIRSQMKLLQYRMLSTEPFFIHDLGMIEPAAAPYPIERVVTQELADRLAQAARSRQILPDHLTADPPPIRQYVCLDGEIPVGWVQSVEACGARWCSNMAVKPPYRRRGIARALMTRMLLDDREAGAQASVLLASHAGAKLYPSVGYRQIGKLLIYAPPRSRCHLSSPAP